MSDCQNATGNYNAQASGPNSNANVNVTNYNLTLPGVKLLPYDTVPPFPPYFISRPELTETSIKELLFRKHCHPVAIEGMGGIGKTVAAIEICHDERIRRVFSDGILWTSFGKQSEITTEARFKTFAENLNLAFKTYSSASYRSMLKDKSVLVVLDDVWEQEDIDPFLLDAGGSRLLYTTRTRNLSSSVDAKSFDVALLDGLEARRFLARYSGRELSTLPEPQADQILSECKGLVLAIAMIGSTLKGKGSDQSNSAWDRVMRGLSQARLKDVGKKASGSRFSSIAASIAASVEELPAEDRNRYFALAILIEDMPAHSTLLQQIWGGNLDDVEEAMDRLVDLSLASRDATGGILLHDLQLDFIRDQSPSPESLKLVHRALVRSLHLIRLYPDQLAAQLTGRLFSLRQQPGMAQLLQTLEANRPRPCLWPLWPTLEPPGSPTVRIFGGGEASVKALALSADGRRAVSASSDGNLHVWDLASNSPPQVLEGPADSLLSVALSADGKRAISGSEDGSVQVWYLESKAPPILLHRHSENVDAVSISADGKRAISGSYDKTLYAWDLDRTSSPQILEEQAGRVTAVALSSDGKRAVSSAWDRTLRVWDLNSDDPPRVLEGHTGKVVSVAISGDGKHAVSGSWDRTVRVWNLEDDSPPRVLEGHTQKIVKVAISADGHVAASASADWTLRLWDLKNNMPPRILDDHSLPVDAVAFNADGTRALSASAATLRLWNFENIFATRQTQGHTKAVTAVAITLDGKNVISSSLDEVLLVWDLEGHATARVIKDGTGAPGVVRVLAAYGTYGIAASLDRTLFAWDLEGTSKPLVLEGHIRSLALSANGKRAISGLGDGSIVILDLHTGTPPRILQGHEGPVNAVSVSADGSRAVSGSEDKTVRVWNLEGDMAPLVFQDHTSRIENVAISIDGRRVVVSSLSDSFFAFDHTHRIFNIESTAPPINLEDCSPWSGAIAFSSDGKQAVSASGHKLLVWDVCSGATITAFFADNLLSCCAWRGNYIAAGDAHGQVYLFHWFD